MQKIVFSCGIAMAVVQKQQKSTHGSIKPANVILCNDQVFKLSDIGTVSFPRLFQKYQKERQTPDIRFWSPEALRAARENRFIKYDIYRSDVYSLGLTLLQTALPIEIPRLNDPRSSEHKPEIEKFVTQAEQGFGPAFGNLLRRMLQTDPRTRPDCATLVYLPEFLEFTKTRTQDIAYFINTEPQGVPGSANRYMTFYEEGINEGAGAQALRNARRDKSPVFHNPRENVIVNLAGAGVSPMRNPEQRQKPSTPIPARSKNGPAYMPPYPGEMHQVEPPEDAHVLRPTKMNGNIPSEDIVHGYPRASAIEAQSNLKPGARTQALDYSTNGDQDYSMWENTRNQAYSGAPAEYYPPASKGGYDPDNVSTLAPPHSRGNEPVGYPKIRSQTPNSRIDEGFTRPGRAEPTPEYGMRVPHSLAKGVRPLPPPSIIPRPEDEPYSGSQMHDDTSSGIDRPFNIALPPGGINRRQVGGYAGENRIGGGPPMDAVQTPAPGRIGAGPYQLSNTRNHPRLALDDYNQQSPPRLV
jgi:serine/threonine protein kinase